MAITTIWANGKIGEIIPAQHVSYIFVEQIEVDGRKEYKYREEEWKDKCPVLAIGFVYYWLRFRKRSSERAKRLDIIGWKPDNSMTPTEIFEHYIQIRKQSYLEKLHERPDYWKITDPEKMFYEKGISKEDERERIEKSFALLEYLDEEDIEEYKWVMKNYLEYVAYIVESYQQEMENRERQKRIERNSQQIGAFCQHAEEIMEKEWPNPERKHDENIYTIDSLEIQELAKSLTGIQVDILQQLVIHQCQIQSWEENPVLNAYSKREIWEASCTLFTECLINAFIDNGHVSALEIEDKGKLVLRKHKESPHFKVKAKNKTIKQTKTTKKNRKRKGTTNPKKKKVRSIEAFPNFLFNYPSKPDNTHFAHRIILAHRLMVKSEWIPDNTKVDAVYDLFFGNKSCNLIKWIGGNSSAGLLGYVFRELINSQNVVVPEADNEKTTMWDILSKHFVDAQDYPMDITKLRGNSCREFKKSKTIIEALTKIFDPSNRECNKITKSDQEEIKSFFNHYGIDKTDMAGMSKKYLR